MAEIIRIEDIARYVGQTSPSRAGSNKTGKGKLQFLQVRDGTGIIQAVVFRGNVSEEVFEAAKRLPQEVIADRHRHRAGRPRARPASPAASSST